MANWYTAPMGLLGFLIKIGALLLIVGIPIFLYNAIDLFSVDWDLSEFDCEGLPPPRACSDFAGVLLLTCLGALLTLAGAILLFISQRHRRRQPEQSSSSS